MSTAIEFIHARGEYASFLIVIALLLLTAGTTSRLFALRPREVGDLFFNAAVAFVIAGRLAYLALEAPRTLLDPLVLLRFQAGLAPLAGVAGAAAVVVWHARGRDPATRWALAGAGSAGLALATVGYDLACVARDACYGVEAPAPLGFEMAGLSEPRVATPLLEAALILAALALLLALPRRLSTAAFPLILVAVLALVRAALTPASALGPEAVGPDTILLVAVGGIALTAAITRRIRTPARA